LKPHAAAATALIERISGVLPLRLREKGRAAPLLS